MRLIYSKNTTAAVFGTRVPMGETVMSTSRVITLAFASTDALDDDTVAKVKSGVIQSEQMESVLDSFDRLGCSIDFGSPAEMMQLANILNETVKAYMEATAPRQTH